MSYNLPKIRGACLSSTVRKSHRTGLAYQQMKTLKHWKVQH